MAPAQCDLSIIVPTYNRSATLRLCLDALARQTVASDRFEVIVSDDGSTDDTEEVVRSLKGRTVHRLLYLRQPNSGAGAARNNAIRQASGRLVLMINDDTIAIETLAEQHLAAHRKYPRDNYAVLGRVTISREVPPSMFSQLHLDASYGKLNGERDLGWRWFFTCNLSVKRVFLLNYGLFETSIRVQHEDLELGERLSHHGLRIIYCPEALGYHHHFIDEPQFLRAARQDGESLARWYNKSPHLRKELASLGCYCALPLAKRVKYAVARVVLNGATLPGLTLLARRIAHYKEPVSLKLYLRIYQAIKRSAIRDELRRLQASAEPAKDS